MTNATPDSFPILKLDHIEFYVGNAKQSSVYYSQSFGFLNTAYRGFETGDRERASYVMEQGRVRFVLTAGTTADSPIAKHAYRHGDGVAVIAIEVPDAAEAYRVTTERGAEGAIEPTTEEDAHGRLAYSAIRSFGDTLIKFVERTHYDGVFAPGFRACGVPVDRFHAGVGLREIDHIVGNVEKGMMNRWVDFFAQTMGFSQLVHFDENDISTEYSALMSKVMQDGTGRIKFPINEPAEGRRRSQIQEYLDYYGGPGVQHVAMLTSDIVATVRQLCERGIEFLRVPQTYYEDLSQRVGPIQEPLDDLAELGILVDRDDEGYLLQIFTKAVEDRPTVFFEIIQRRGSRGFGIGNFKALFESLEREQEIRGNL